MHGRRVEKHLLVEQVLIDQPFRRAVRRDDADVEAAVYFTCAEALQNTAKHAGPGATAHIAISHNGSRLAFEVRDDGSGFAHHVNAGRGRANMQDRIGALGGHLRIGATPGGGTTVQGWVDDVETLDPAAPSEAVSGRAS